MNENEKYAAISAAQQNIKSELQKILAVADVADEFVRSRHYFAGTKLIEAIVEFIGEQEKLGGQPPEVEIRSAIADALDTFSGR